MLDARWPLCNEDPPYYPDSLGVKCFLPNIVPYYISLLTTGDYTSIEKFHKPTSISASLFNDIMHEILLSLGCHHLEHLRWVAMVVVVMA